MNSKKTKATTSKTLSAPRAKAPAAAKPAKAGKPITDLKGLLRAKSKKKTPRGGFASISPGTEGLEKYKIRFGSEKAGTVAELPLEAVLHDALIKLGLHVDFDILLPAPASAAV